MSQADLLRTGMKRSIETFHRYPSDDEVMRIKQEVIDNVFEIETLENELKSISKDYKESIKRLKEKNTRLLPVAKDSFEVVKEEVRLVADDERGLVLFYDEDGNEVGSRAQTASEKISIFNN